jgi:hypothetical protein
MQGDRSMLWLRKKALKKQYVVAICPGMVSSDKIIDFVCDRAKPITFLCPGELAGPPYDAGETPERGLGSLP